MSLISVNEGKEWAELGTLMDEARSDVSEYVYVRKKMEQWESNLYYKLRGIKPTEKLRG